MASARRRLPHWAPETVTVFVTWRLAGTLPVRTEEARFEDRLSEGRTIAAKIPGNAAGIISQPVGRTVLPSAGKRFVAQDGELDRAAFGPTWLKDARVAGMIVDALNYGASTRGFYDLQAFVVMPNHVHVVWQPKIAMSRVLQWLKGVTSKRAKRILGMTEGAFWQDESYDHWVRSEGEFQRVIRYVESNPVKAGLAESIEAWPWSSATLPQTTRSSAPQSRVKSEE
jgi:putative transposase